MGTARRSPRKTSGAAKNQIACVDPGTQELLGHVPAMSAKQVGKGLVKAARAGWGVVWSRRQVVSMLPCCHACLRHAEAEGGRVRGA